MLSGCSSAKNKNFRRAGNVGDAEELSAFGIVLVGGGGGQVAGIADHGIHRITANLMGPNRPRVGPDSNAVAGAPDRFGPTCWRMG